MSVRGHWKTILGLIVVFAAGIGVGSVGTVRAIQHHYQQRMDQATWTPQTLAWMHDKLGISDAQRKEVLPIVEKGMDALAALRDKTAGQRKQIVHDMFVEAAAHMTPEQRDRLRSYAPGRGNVSQLAAALAN